MKRSNGDSQKANFAWLEVKPIKERPLAFLKLMLDAGHKEALPIALTICLREGGEPPEWLRRAWLKAHEAAREGNDWNGALGSPSGKGAHGKDRKLHDTLRHRIVCRVLENGKVIPEVFKQIAEEIKADGIKVSASTVKSIYYRPEGRMLRVLIKWCKRHGFNSDFLA
jgi:hypothetical protein